MISVTIPEAKSRLVELIDQVNAGEEVVIMRRGMPIARLTPGTPKNRLTRHNLAPSPGTDGDTLLGGLDSLDDTRPL